MQKTNEIKSTEVDVLSIGFACMDLNLTTEHHPAPREKVMAQSLYACGGGPAANAAITIARLGGKARFCGYIGKDGFGQSHIRELQADGVLIDTIRYGNVPTPIASIIIKPNGARSIVSYRHPQTYLRADAASLKKHPAKVLLLDGHQPELSIRLTEEAKELGVPVVLDAGSINPGTTALYDKVDYLVASAKYAYQLTGLTDPCAALAAMRGAHPSTR